MLSTLKIPTAFIFPLTCLGMNGILPLHKSIADVEQEE